MKRLLVVCALAGVAACLTAAGSSASSSTSAASLSVAPAAPLVGDSLVFSGCGYTPGVDVEFQAIHNTKTGTWILQISETIDTGGCFSTVVAPYVAPDAGKWTATVSEFSTGHKDATLIFTVG